MHRYVSIMNEARDILMLITMKTTLEKIIFEAVTIYKIRGTCWRFSGS